MTNWQMSVLREENRMLREALEGRQKTVELGIEVLKVFSNRIKKLETILNENRIDYD